MTGPSEIGLFFGRLHPLLVHLPIGLIVLLVFLELVARFPRFRQANANVGVILTLAVPAAALAVVCGWLLASGGGYEAGLLQWHRWTGIGTACVCALAALLYWLNLKRAYRWCLFGSFLALVVASHFGGSLTHGSDYLVRYAPGPLRTWLGDVALAPAPPKPKDVQQLQVFGDVIRPVLQKDCVSCHGPEKIKGKLRLDSLEALRKGGSSGPAIIPDKAAASELVRRLKLPSTSEDHMPPQGKPQPSADEIALLQWWIDSGAPAEKRVAELKPSASVKRILTARFGGAAPAVKVVRALPLNQVLPVAAELGGQLHIAISPLSPKEPWLQCDANIAGTNFGDAQLARLTPLAANLRWLDLAGTRITDAGLAQLAAMRNLVRLHLERTAVTDAGLAALNDLPDLEYLDLYSTAITDAGLDRLQELPRLKQVFVWQTRVSAGAAQAFIQARTDADQLQQWQKEIEMLQANIKDARVSVDLGTQLAAAPSTNAVPVNANCPVSGKPVNPTKTVLREGLLVAFCCDNCKAKFQQDPKPYLVKLGPAAPKDLPSQPGK